MKNPIYLKRRLKDIHKARTRIKGSIIKILKNRLLSSLLLISYPVNFRRMKAMISYQKFLFTLHKTIYITIHAYILIKFICIPKKGFRLARKMSLYRMGYNSIFLKCFTILCHSTANIFNSYFIFY